MCLAVGAKLLNKDESEGEDWERVVEVELEEHDEGRNVLSDPGPRCVGIQGE